QKSLIAKSGCIVYNKNKKECVIFSKDDYPTLERRLFLLRLKKYEPHQHKWSPEIADGFDYLSKVAFKTNHSPLRPVSFFTLAKPGENYEIKLTIKAKEEVPELLLYTGRRQFRGYLTFQKGEQKNFTFYQSLTEIIPDFEK